MRKTALYILLVCLVIYIVFPFFWTFLSSIKYERDLYTYTPKWVPYPYTFKRYTSLITAREELMASPGQIVGGETLKSFRYGFLNSFVVAGLTTLVCLFVGSLAAYSFARFQSRTTTSLFALTIILRLMPVVVLAIPLYMMMRSFNLLDSKSGLVLTYSSFTLPLIIWIMKVFFETVPIELEDAARIDGCSLCGALFRVVLPISVPGLVAAGLFAFIMAWQEFLFALVFTSSTVAKTLPVAMAEFFGRQGMDYGMVSTGSILASIPIMLIALLTQKYIIKGLTMGGVKG